MTTAQGEGRLHLAEAVWQLETLVDNYLDTFTEAHQSQILLACTTLQAVLRDLTVRPDTTNNP